MQDLLERFDWYLKGVGEQLRLSNQSNQGQWRIEDRYLPDGMESISLDLGGAMMNVAGTITILPNGTSVRSTRASRSRILSGYRDCRGRY